LGKDNNISPGLINRWRRQYLNGELNVNNNQEIKKLQTQLVKLEQMNGKLTTGNHILKKRERIFTRKEKRGFIYYDPPYLNSPKRNVD